MVERRKSVRKSRVCRETNEERVRKWLANGEG